MCMNEIEQYDMDIAVRSCASESTGRFRSMVARLEENTQDR